jgi:hypothetical protein
VEVGPEGESADNNFFPGFLGGAEASGAPSFGTSGAGVPGSTGYIAS